MNRHYLDHTSTSPLRPDAATAMHHWIESNCAGDPGRIHCEGKTVRVAIENARDQVAAMFNVSSRQVIFTHGATESINMANWGAAKSKPGGTFLVPGIEHSSVFESSALHGSIVAVRVDHTGTLDVDALRDAIDEAGGGEQIALAHCQWANHEVGSIQPLSQISALCHERGILVHSDAAAAAGHIRVDMTEHGIDMVSLSAHKFGGPPGIGALLLRRGLRIAPLMVGGSQERGRRAGMENALAIIGFGAAAQSVSETMEHERMRSTAQISRIRHGASQIQGITSFGNPANQLPHIACFGIDGVEAEPILLGLDSRGIAVHSGSACSSESLEPSPVLAAMGVDAERSLRVSVGWSTTEGDVDAFLHAFPDVVQSLRSLRRSV